MTWRTEINSNYTWRTELLLVSNRVGYWKQLGHVWVHIICSHGGSTNYQIQEAIDKWPVLVTHVSPVKTKLVLPTDTRLVGTFRHSGLSHVALLPWAQVQETTPMAHHRSTTTICSNSPKFLVQHANKKLLNLNNMWRWLKKGRSVKTTHIQESYFVSMHEKTPILLWRPNGQIVFYFKSPVTFVFCRSTKFVVLCFIFRHIACFVFYFKSRLRFSFRF